MTAEPKTARDEAAAAPPFEIVHERARTERERMRVTVKEREDGRPFLTFQCADLPSLPGVCFGLDLAPETTLEHASWLASRLNGWAVSLHAVIFEPRGAGGAGDRYGGGDVEGGDPDSPRLAR